MYAAIWVLAMAWVVRAGSTIPPLTPEQANMYAEQQTRTWYKLGRELLNTGRPDQAIPWLLEVNKRNPFKTHLWQSATVLLAVSYERQGKYALAHHYFAESAKYGALAFQARTEAGAWRQVRKAAEQRSESKEGATQ